jgi:prepilin-type N-terminal cleavage/methylation domain-containing protein
MTMMRLDMRAGSERSGRSVAGFTLIEVLATVVILSLFVTTLLTLFGQMLAQMTLSDQRQQAQILAREELGQMVVSGANAIASGPRPQPQVIHGVQYQVAPSILTTTTSPPEPSWAVGLVYAEVKVTWTTLVNGKSNVQSVSLGQVFPN